MMTIHEEIKCIHKRYQELWLYSENSDMDMLMHDLLNELEDIYNPSRLNGN